MNKLFGNLGIGNTCTAHLEFTSPTSTPLPTITIKGRKGEPETVPIFTNKDTITGTVKVLPIPGKRVEHQGIRVQLVGEIELASDRGHPHEFVSLVRDLAPPGELYAQQIFPFEFKSVEMEYESYRGTQVRLKYALRVTVVRGLGQSFVKDYAFWVQNPVDEMPVAIGTPIKMEVGIEDCLHIEFEYQKGSFHLTDTVLGKIYFLLVRIKLKHMELEIRRKESVGGGASARSESTTIAKYEIMDGAPVKGEVIPIRMHIAPYEVTPSYPNVSNKFSVKYSLNLVLVDEEDRRYFKQQEVTLYRLKGSGNSSGGESGGGGVALTPRAAERVLSSSNGNNNDSNGNGGGSGGHEEDMQQVGGGAGNGGGGSEGLSSPL